MNNILLVTLKLLSVSFVPLLAPNPDAVRHCLESRRKKTGLG